MIQDNIKTRVVGVDIILDKTTCAIVDIRGNIIASTSFASTDYPFIGDYLAVLSEHILTMVEANGGYESVRSVGLSIPSGNFLEGSLVNSPNLPWKGVIPLAAMLRDRLGIAVALGNNAHVVALGEYTFGAAHGMKDFVVVSIDSGLGSCFYSGGLAHLGASGFAGEIGHTCLIPNGRECGCGNRGCLEAYTATKGIIRTAQEVMAESDKPSHMRQVEKLTPRIIAAFCDDGDELAIETFRRTGYWLGLGLANYASVVNPEAFIFTGAVSRAGKWLLEPACESFEQHVFHNVEGKVKFVLSSIEDDVRNVLGASALAWDVKEYSLFK
jgi:glucokinase